MTVPPTGRRRTPRRTPPPSAEAARESLAALREEVGKAVVGQDAAVTGLVIALLCQGHVLLEGVPGVAKTLLVRTLAASLSLDSKRVQFTPDLMPGDITGSLVYDARTANFEFHDGPVFTNLLLADEINRTPPKTQAALLEAMEERQVSVEGRPRPLPSPFLVAATQNPVEYDGTYPLPEAQLDRFLAEAHGAAAGPRGRDGGPAAPRRRLRPARPGCRRGARPWRGRRTSRRPGAPPRRSGSSPEVLGYVVDVCRATRVSPSLSLGASPRGATALLATSKAWAWLSGRDYLTPDDVKALARPTLRHRVSVRPEAELEGRHRRRRARRRPRRGAGPALATGRTMALTGRAALLAFLGTAVVVVVPAGGASVAVLLLALAVLVAVDVALAASPRAVELGRDGAEMTRLGEATEVVLLVRNAGPRRLRGRVRDAWPPSAGASPAFVPGRHRARRPGPADIGAATAAARRPHGGRRDAAVRRTAGGGRPAADQGRAVDGARPPGVP